MTRGRVLFIFIVLLIGFYFVSTGLLGVNGYFYNKTLERLLLQRHYQQDKISVELNSLIERQLQLASSEGLKDAAVSLGYYTQDDGIYFFTSSSTQDAVYAGNIWDTEVKLFKPLNKTVCFTIAFIGSAIITFTIALIAYVKHRDYSEKDSEDDTPEQETLINKEEFDNFRV